MKSKKVLIIIIVVILLTISIIPTVAFASAPYDTYTNGPEGKLVATQTAYQPKNKISLTGEYSASNPQDMFFDSESKLIYITATLSGRVVVCDLDGKVVSVIGEEILESPYGITGRDNLLYVADKGKKEIFVFDKSLSNYPLIQTISKPTSPLVGKETPFVPIKLSVDSRGNIYVVSEGSVNGVMQLNSRGEFIANVGANKTRASLESIIQKLFYSDEQINSFFATPRSPLNIAIDSKGLLYTVTTNAVSETIKKLNSLGSAIMSPIDVNKGSTVAIAIDKDDNIYGVDAKGYITIYDSYGDVLFMFAGKSDEERLGSLSAPVAIAIMDNGNILVLDSNYSMVVQYTRTQFADLVFTAVGYYKEGLYLDGENYWKEILQYNSSFILSYKALARANMKRGDYEQALTQFKLAEDKDGYSEAYWEIRNVWLNKNLWWLISGILIVTVAVLLIKVINKKKKNAFVPLKALYSKVVGVTVIRQLGAVKRFMMSPKDAVYEVKYHKASSVISASVLYVFFVVIQILSVFIKGYLFNNSTIYNTNALEVILYSTIPLLLLVVANYFVSTVTEGEGKFTQCYTVFIYALSPYLVMAIPVFIVSNFVTYNETIVYQILSVVMYVWSAINLFSCIMELHDYSFWQTVKNILLTLFAFAMALLFVIVLVMLTTQLFGYFGELFTEVFHIA
ncbi:MAG: hypothetical protein RRY18_00995 [Clostridia bacterium]